MLVKCGGGGEMKGAHIPVVVAQQNIEDYFRVVCWGLALTSSKLVDLLC